MDAAPRTRVRGARAEGVLATAGGAEPAGGAAVGVDPAGGAAAGVAAGAAVLEPRVSSTATSPARTGRVSETTLHEADCSAA